MLAYKAEQRLGTGETMRRREFIALMGASVAWPPVVRAQEAGRVYRLGSLLSSPRSAPHYVALFEELQRRGFIERQNLIADPNGYRLSAEQLSEHAAEIVKARVDVILCTGNAAIRAAQEATKTIPILGLTDDMLGSGLVNSLARPNGNTTGVSVLATELDGKRQEILIEAVPGLRRMAALADSNTMAIAKLEALEEAAAARNVALSIHQIARGEEIAAAIDMAKGSGATALNVLASPMLFANRHLIMDSAAALALPAIYNWPETAEEGGFAAYGPRLVAIFRDLLARQLVQLLRGTKIADIPVEQPTKFELVINLKTAKCPSGEFLNQVNQL
jgi:putative tryptophan/tyrosine transport system substrate-binding protein